MSPRSSRRVLSFAFCLALPLLSGLALGESGARSVQWWPTATMRAEAGLAAKLPEERVKAVRGFLKLPRGAVVRLLPKALNDEAIVVRIAAAEAALALNVASAAEWVVPWLNDSDDRLRRVAVRVLGAFTLSDAAFAALTRALSDTQPEVRREAALALGRARKPEAVPALLARLDDNDPNVQVANINALAGLRDARAVVPLINKLQEPRSAVRRAAAHALARLKDERATGALLLALADSDETVRLAAVAALGALRDAQAIEPLSVVLTRDRLIRVRVAAASALGQFRAAPAASVLLEALADPRPEVADAAERALAQQTELAPALQSCLSGGGGPKAEACARLLAVVEPGTCAQALTAALRHGVISAAVALDALAMATDPAALPVVLEHLADAAESVRGHAVRAADQLLARQPDGRAVEPIQRALASTKLDQGEVPALLELLGRTGAQRTETVLAGYLEATPVSVRISALTGLGYLAAYSGNPGPVLDALADPHPGVRWATVQMIRNAAPASWAEALLDRLEFAPGQDREAVRLALAGPVSRSFQPDIAERLVQRILRADVAENDRLLEALSRMPRAEPYLKRITVAARQALVPKLAEVLGGHANFEAELRGWLASARPEWRATAAWSLGLKGSAQALPELLQALEAPDAAVASNAIAAAALVAKRAPRNITAELCRALARDVGYAQANALVGLRLLGARCAGARERSLLGPSHVAVVRERAAWLLSSVPGPDQREDAQALESCAEQDPDAAVAQACRGESSPPQFTEAGPGTTLFVTPNQAVAPTPRRPFGLVSQGGFIRMGWSDRGGAIWEPQPSSVGSTLLVP
jgi:cellulose synthase operon protein C